MLHRITVDSPLLRYLDFESAACGDTGRDAALDALAATYQPSDEYPTLADAEAALIAGRESRAHEQLVVLMLDYGELHAIRMRDQQAQAQEAQARAAFLAYVEQMKEEAKSEVVVTSEVLNP